MASARSIALFRKAVGHDLPRLWRSVGFDAALGLPFEKIDAQARAVATAERRAMACARQLYFFCRAADYADRAENLAHADRLYEGLLTFRDHRHGGWCYSNLDGRKDLYALAFVLFALAAYDRARATGPALALETLDWIERRLALESGWYAHGGDADGANLQTELLQNPHMHLLEACLAWVGRPQDAAFRACAGKILRLFDARLCNAQGHLGEFFDASGAPDAARGHILEPGHHAEWFWLLAEAEAKLGQVLPEPKFARLFLTAERGGRLGQGLCDAIDRQHKIITPSKRLWPQLEYLRALTVRKQQDACAVHLDFIMAHYYREGHWIEWLKNDLTVLDSDHRASTPYHLMTALEVIAPMA